MPPSRLTFLSLLLCATVCVVWATRVQHRRVGNGWLFRGSRYTLLLSPDRLMVVGPPPLPTDPAAAWSVGEIAEKMHATGGTLRYHGTTGGMGFGDFEFFGVPPVVARVPRIGAPVVPPMVSVPDGSIRTLMAALEDERFFLLAHALLTQTDAGGAASDYPGPPKYLLKQTAGRPGHWTAAYDDVGIDVVEDRPREGAGSWGEEIWGVVTTPGMTPGERARVCRRWHERLDVPLWTVRYWRIALLALALPAAYFASRVAGGVRHGRRRAAGRCVACGYDLRASPDRCPECGTIAAGTGT